VKVYQDNGENKSWPERSRVYYTHITAQAAVDMGLPLKIAYYYPVRLLVLDCGHWLMDVNENGWNEKDKIRCKLCFHVKILREGLINALPNEGPQQK